MNTFEWTVPLRFGLALALGFLVGLERESAKEHQKVVFGGVRTHPLISLLGFGCAWLYQLGSVLALPAGLAALSALTVVAYLTKVKDEHFGTTSEISALLTFVTGALTLLVDIWAPMALGIVNAMLLSEKARLESFVDNLNKAEFLATLKFLLVTVIILPVLPDREYTEFRINPSDVWKLVIVVSTVGFVGYVLIRRLGAKVGLRWSGLLGGVVSSTAVTMAMGRMARKDQSHSRSALQASLLGGAMMYPRILVILILLAPLFAGILWWKLLVLALVGFGLAASVRGTQEEGASREVPGLENPFEITPSVIFAGLFVALTVIVGIVKNAAGESGIFGLALLVGVVDIDPFILSISRGISVETGVLVNAMLLAMLSNTLAKGIYFGAFVPALRWQSIVRYAIWAAAHIPLLLVV